MEKKKYEKPGIEIRLVGVVLILIMVLIEGASFFGIWSLIDAYWLRSAIAEVVMCLPILIYFIRCRGQFVAMMRLNPVKIRVILLAVLIEICITPLAGLCNLITELFTPNTVNEVMGVYIDTTPYGLMIISMAIIPAIVEEIAMRGVVLSAFSRSGRKFAAILFASACFGLIHGNINQFAYAFVVGTVMAIVDEAADSIFPSMAMHFFTNGFSITFMYILQYSTITAEQAKGFMAQLGEETQEAEIVLPEEVVETVVNATMIITIAIVAALAVGGLFATSKLIAKIAQISGRTEYMKSIKPKFGKRKKAALEAGDSFAASQAGVNPVPELPKTRILNPALIVGMALWVGIMIFYELLVHGVIKL
ncbi:MAG: CPBP family intramembrane metalloprotease [Lachnospiraceae bacterium]|nr:CPBP family intramembrane metalloprotease [Lachnospiraceae bacterium]